jgi:UDP-N-acetylglucosamine acyltransferase
MVHQFCNIGPYSMSAGGSIVLKDIPAYVMVSGQSASAHGLNVEGLRRRGFSNEVIAQLKKAYKIIYRQGLTMTQALEALEADLADLPEAQPLMTSLRNAERGIVR